MAHVWRVRVGDVQLKLTSTKPNKPFGRAIVASALAAYNRKASANETVDGLGGCVLDGRTLALDELDAPIAALVGEEPAEHAVELILPATAPPPPPPPKTRLPAVLRALLSAAPSEQPSSERLWSGLKSAPSSRFPRWSSIPEDTPCPHRTGTWWPGRDSRSLRGSRRPEWSARPRRTSRACRRS